MALHSMVRRIILLTDANALDYCFSTTKPVRHADRRTSRDLGADCVFVGLGQSHGAFMILNDAVARVVGPLHIDRCFL